MGVIPQGLDKLQGRYIRYWTVADRDRQCEFGWLISFDSHGLLLSGEDAKRPNSIDGAVFIGWDKIDHLQFVEDDEKEIVEERCHGSGEAGSEAQEAHDEAARGGEGSADAVGEGCGPDGLPEIGPGDLGGSARSRSPF